MSLIEEYFSLQEEYSNKYGEKTIIFMEKGMFYEIYGIDNIDEKKGQAHTVAQILNIQLTKANKKIEGNSMTNPFMTGFPVVSLNKNMKILLQNGYTIVTYDQAENMPSDRSITNVFSPGTYIDEQNTNTSNYMCSVYFEKEDGTFYCGLSFVELSTGKLFTYEKITNDQILVYEEISRNIESFNSKEYTVVLKNIEEKIFLKNINGADKLIHFNRDLSSNILRAEYQNEVFDLVYKLGSNMTMLEEFDMEKMTYASASLVNMLQFCYEHNSSILDYIEFPVVLEDKMKCVLHNNALYQLNIISTNSRKEKGITCLFDVVNHTSTPMGKRLLNSTLLNPITDIRELNRMYKEVDDMFDCVNWYENELKSILDFERYHRKMGLQRLSPYEYANLHSTYQSVNNILTQKYGGTDICKQFGQYYNDYLITFNLSVMRQCNNIGDIQNNIFNVSVSEELDKIQNSIDSYRAMFETEGRYLSNQLNQKENVIRFEYSSKNGYSFFSTSVRCDQLSKHHKIKEKYHFKKESKAKCSISSDKINRWMDELTKNQNSLKPTITEVYQKITNDIFVKHKTMFTELGDLIANLDVVKSKAKGAMLNNYCKPEVFESDEGMIDAVDMRHAIIECLDTDCDYVPNNINLNTESSGILLYGVNGSGKSCYSKSVGLCVVLAQCGHFVPCTKFVYSPFTRLYTRITGDDNIFRGHSSFFVEMSELKSIMNYADSKSIVIGDEVCKGTEDVSAVAIVGTALKNLLERGTKFIFATHLHKLPSISVLKNNTRLKIKHISIEFEESTIYTRKLKDGSGDILYGLEIAHSILKNEDFHTCAFKLRNELLNRSSKIVADKKSKYNGKIYVNHCQICGEKDNLEAHHIIFQSRSPVRKDRKSNLVVLCREHHDNIHSGNLIVEGWQSTTDGKMLRYYNA